MLTFDTQILGFSEAQWFRLAEVFRPNSTVLADERETQGAVLLVTHEQQPVAVFSTQAHAAAARDLVWPCSLQVLAETYHARFAAVLSQAALNALFERFALRIHRNQTYLDQVLALLLVSAELEREGKLELWPHSLANLPIPAESTLDFALDTWCKDGQACVLGVFDNEDLYTALAVRRKGRSIDLALGPEILRPKMGILSGDFRRDWRYLSEVVEAELGPLAFGYFGTKSTFQQIANEREAGAFAAAVLARDVILAPASLGALAPIGLDAGRAAWKGVQALVGVLRQSGYLGADLSIAWDRVSQTVDQQLIRERGSELWHWLVAMLDSFGKKD